jgi:hypothetical protein
MGWPRKKKDPISERERSLRAEIEQLEAQIRELSSAGAAPSSPADPAPSPSAGPIPARPATPAPSRPGPQPAAAGPVQPRPTHAAPPRDSSQPRLRSTALPGGQTVTKPVLPSAARPVEQVFEKVDHQRLQTPPEAASKALYNELGVRKYDLPGAWQRIKGFFQGSTAQNQTLVKLLAAGNIQGLRPLRYEKRVARRRFVIFVMVLFLVLWGIIAMFLRR